MAKICPKFLDLYASIYGTYRLRTMANNINAALMRADLAKLPLWSGDVFKDGYTIEQWVTRVNKAATTATWSDEDTMAYVYNALRGPALRWLESLKRFNVNIDSWAAVRTEMLDAYSRVQTARRPW